MLARSCACQRSCPNAQSDGPNQRPYQRKHREITANLFHDTPFVPFCLPVQQASAMRFTRPRHCRGLMFAFDWAHRHLRTGLVYWEKRDRKTPLGEHMPGIRGTLMGHREDISGLQTLSFLAGDRLGRSIPGEKHTCVSLFVDSRKFQCCTGTNSRILPPSWRQVW